MSPEASRRDEGVSSHHEMGGAPKNPRGEEFLPGWHRVGAAIMAQLSARAKHREALDVHVVDQRVVVVPSIVS